MASVRTSLEASVEATLSTLGELGQRCRPAQPITIFRVPDYVRESNRAAYEPRMVSIGPSGESRIRWITIGSRVVGGAGAPPHPPLDPPLIGPYYHGCTGLRTMEHHKWRYLHDLLSRNPAVSSSVLIQAMRSVEARARACYSERPLLGPDDFVQMLLLDGCFILEFCFKWHTKEPDVGRRGRGLVRSDLLLPENQVPFFVIEKLYDVVTGVQGGRELLLNLFLEYTRNEEEEPITRPSGDSEIHHLLHLYYHSFVPKLPPPEPNSLTVFSKKTLVIPPATELSNIGVTFVVVHRRRRGGVPSMFDVTFDCSRGVMKIPCLEIDNSMALLLSNLISFEHNLQQGEENVVVGVLTNYMCLMSMLVRTAEDVALLRLNGIWGNVRTNDQELARFFSNLGDACEVTNHDWLFAGLCEDVVRYGNSWRRRNWAALKRTELMIIYFRSPWSIISVVAAALVILLTATQTYYAVFPKR